MLSNRQSFAIALAILLLSAFLRMTDLATLPAGISDHEITNARLVGNAQGGDVRVFYAVSGEGFEGLYHTAVALITTLTGEGTIGFRLLSVWLSLISIAIVYTLSRHLFNPIAAVLAMGLLAVNMTSNLLAREISSDGVIIFFSVGVMFALARSLPIYRTTRVVTANTVSFAALGVLWGASFYVHPSSLFIVLGSMVYILYLLIIRRAMSRRRLSYTGFAILVMLIIAMPYLISSISLPEIAAVQRLLGAYPDGITRSIIDGIRSVAVVGDMNPLHNLPGRPLVDAFSGLFILIGLGVMVSKWREPRFMLVLIMGTAMIPAAFAVENSPNFSKYGVILPHLMILFGVGVYSILRLSIFSDTVFRRMAIGGILLLLGFNLLWTWEDFFVTWRNQDDVITAVNGDLGQIAHHLDMTGNQTPTVLCNSTWNAEQLSATLNRTEKMLVMMNRGAFRYREADCRQSLIFTGGGAKQQIVLIDGEQNRMFPYLRDWLAYGEFVNGSIPRHSIIEIEVSQQLADRAGSFITTAPVAYAPEAVGAIAPVSPPIRFGGNLTLLGYEPAVERFYLPGETINVITYWRVEGIMPPDLNLFTHVLSDPVTLFANRDVISVNPNRLQARDVFIQVTQIEMPKTALPIEYFISVGAYQKSSDNRLPSLLDDEPYGDRIFLYSIDVLPLNEDEEGAP